MTTPPKDRRGRVMTHPAIAADADASRAVDRLLARLVALAEDAGAEAVLDELIRFARPEDRERDA